MEQHFSFGAVRNVTKQKFRLKIFDNREDGEEGRGREGKGEGGGGCLACLIKSDLNV